MNKKLLGIILILISLLIALSILYFMFFYKPAAVQKAQEDQNNKPAVTTPTTTIEQKPVVVLPKKKEEQPAPSTEVSEEQARQTAASFAELYGSYSNQGDKSRLKDLKFYVTPAYLDVLTKQSASINANYTVYSGHESRAIATQILIMEETRAVMVITTMRKDVAADGSEKNFNQDLKVELTKSGEKWQVSNAVWQ